MSDVDAEETSSMNSTPNQPKTPMVRRSFIAAGAAAIIGGGLFAARWVDAGAAAATNATLTAETAFDLASQGALYLIDIRRPEEWEATGIASPAIPVDMRRDDFESCLLYTSPSPRDA